MIKIENVSYGYKSKYPIFNSISLEIGTGIYGLLGENGIGKSTLIHLLCGLLFPWKGECILNGKNTAERKPEVLSNYFFLPEEMQIPDKSIRKFAATHSVFYPRFNRKEFEQNLEELLIDGDQKLTTVSFGQQKKAMLAYALALHTPLTILDEPTNGLDITACQSLKRIISRSADDDGTLLISTHQAHYIENLLDHLIILGKGEILLNRSLDEISSRLLFVHTSQLPEECIYSEQDLSGYFSILPNEEEEENTPDIELLYKAVMQQPGKIKELFK
ncbi:ATP-binding cassette domain-containing protein [Bacteroides sp.]|uniref:ABC transporter ATP-binding protein n=1 Tax=Bacteroides sp. TaxID=29523 RepID=UPI00261E5774|nr:ABC transporter ATP-binding protein [Bacteroides sp.]